MMIKNREYNKQKFDPKNKKKTELVFWIVSCRFLGLLRIFFAQIFFSRIYIKHCYIMVQIAWDAVF